MNTKEDKILKFSKLLDVMDEMREKCPWNAEQTFESLRTKTIEEVFELSESVLEKNDENICKELGDLMLHIVFYGKIASEKGVFDIGDIIDRITEKMIFRHPHVFSDAQKPSSEEVATSWEMIKLKEKGANKRILSGVPDTLPSIIKAYAMQDKARGAGFDWEEKQQVWDKVREEQSEVAKEIESLENAGCEQDKAVAEHRLEEEFGDLLFAVINAARLYGINPDTALCRTCEKFKRRFTYLEEQTLRKGKNLFDMSLEEMDKIWNEAKIKGL